MKILSYCRPRLAARVHLWGLKVSQLRGLAKMKSIVGYSRLLKAELVSRLEAADVLGLGVGKKSDCEHIPPGPEEAGKPATAAHLNVLTVAQLKALAKLKGLRGYSRLAKPGLARLLAHYAAVRDLAAVCPDFGGGPSVSSTAEIQGVPWTRADNTKAVAAALGRLTLAQLRRHAAARALFAWSACGKGELVAVLAHSLRIYEVFPTNEP